MNGGTRLRPEAAGAGAVAAALLVADQLTKLLVSQAGQVMELGPVTIAPLVNRSGVLGLPVANDILLVAGVLIAAGIIWLLRRTARPMLQVGLWLLLAGALGNTIDRVTSGGALDIIAIGPSSHFNLADIWILLGGGALLFGLWRKDAGA